MRRFVALATLLFFAVGAGAASTVTVDCDAGQSLGKSLAKINKLNPATVMVKGTCIEYVLVEGFDDLTLSGCRARPYSSQARIRSPIPMSCPFGLHEALPSLGSRSTRCLPYFPPSELAGAVMMFCCKM